MTSVFIYGLRRKPFGQTKLHSGPPGLAPGDRVLVEEDQGKALAEVVSGPIPVSSAHAGGNLPCILHKADAQALQQGEANERLADEARHFCRDRILERQLEMKLVDVEVYFDRSKLVFYFTAPSRIDFRDLVKDLVREYRARIELRQIGVRHETQMVGAVGNCGMVCCCRRYLQKFVPVTTRMAKEQNLFLNPAKISGICGRLLCCLSYEQENYDHFHRSCPRLGKKYQTTRGVMKVLRANIFRNSLSVLAENGDMLELTLEDWQALSPHRPEAPPGPAPVRQAPQASGEGLLCVFAAPDTLEQVDLIGAEEETPQASGALFAAREPGGSPERETGSGRSRKKGRRKPQKPASG